MRAGFIQSIEGLNRRKDWVKDNLLSLPIFDLGQQSSAFSLTQPTIYIIGSLGSPANLGTIGTSQPPYFNEQIPYKSSIYPSIIYLSVIYAIGFGFGSSPLENPD